MNTPRIVTLECCCCGNETRGRQWWNRDSGFGLCPACIPLCCPEAVLGTVTSSYGERGFHFDLQPAPVEVS